MYRLGFQLCLSGQVSSSSVRVRLRSSEFGDCVSPLNDALLIPSTTPVGCSQDTAHTVMLLRAARSSCLRAPRRLARPEYTVPRSAPWPTAYHGTQLRVFSSLGGSWRKQETGDTAPERKTGSLNSAPASRLANADVIQKQGDTQNATSTKKNDLLSEATVANKEQRKADWAIMREMAKYLWPKVCLCS